MDPRTLRFLLFTAVGVICLAGGYLSRRRGWLREEVSQRVHFHTITWFWTLAGVLGLWRLRLGPELLWVLLFILPLTMGISVAAIIPLARWVGCTKPQVGVMAIGAGIINGGVTLGTYLCYCILGPAELAWPYGAVIGSANLIVAVPMIYPLAQHYSMDSSHRVPVGRLIFKSIFNTRSIGLLSGLGGILLSVLNVPFPQFLVDWYVLDAVAYGCAVGTYFGIGLRLRPGDSLRFLPQHALLACVKFLLYPLLAWSLLHVVARVDAPLPSLLDGAMMIQASVATGTSVVILANLFNLDARLASALWMWNTILFLVVPLPIILLTMTH